MSDPKEKARTVFELIQAQNAAIDALCEALATSLPTTAQAMRSALEEQARGFPQEMQRAREQVARWQTMLEP